MNSLSCFFAHGSNFLSILGYSCDPAGGQLDLMSRRCICASSKELADELVAQLVQFYPQPRDD